jgi:hypothetical protein
MSWHETNPLVGKHKETEGWESWDTPGLKITRLRLLSDPGFPMWDVSYCLGEVDGRHVRVILPFDQLPKKGMKSAIIKHAKRDKVYAKALGILDEANISKLC